MSSDFRSYLIEKIGATSCKEIEVIQPLWSDYGKISRYGLDGSDIRSVIVKHIDLKNANNHPRGWKTDIGHQRKVRSYEVEIEWYKTWNQRCNDSCRTADFIGAFTQKDEHWVILEDLDSQYPVRKHRLQPQELKSCLSWLANFHGTFLNVEPIGLWEVGTYWHLATRPEEFEKIENQEMKDYAGQIDSALNGCRHQTIVHGDAKLANFCFSTDGYGVAAVDFQYVGGGCGMKDVAYLLGSCLSNDELKSDSESLLDFYFSNLKEVISKFNPDFHFTELEQEWRALYPIAWTDFTRFLLGWMPTHQKLNSYSMELMNSVLRELNCN